MIIDFDTIFLVGYMLCFIYLNFVAYLISSFYTKKFNQPSTKSGFFISIVLLLVFFTSLLFKSTTIKYLTVAQMFLILVSSITSTWNSILLFLKMKKVRK